MPDDLDDYCRRAEVLLRRAADEPNMPDRARLIDEALHWHNLAMGAHSKRVTHDNDDRDDEGQATG